MKNALITYEVAILIDQEKIGQLELLYGILFSNNVAPEQITEVNKNSLLYLSVYFDNRNKAIALKIKLVKKHGLSSQVKLNSIKRRDWETLWKKEFKPFNISKNFRVVPTWLKGKKQLKNHIYIDTSTAFGTGMHATTRLMVQLIDRCAGKFQSFIDIGTGTGILTIAAAKSGASYTSAFDISPESIPIAKQNFEDNGIKVDVLKKQDLKKFKLKKKFDYVAANLVTHDLIDLKNELLSLVLPEKYLAVSGISLNNYPLFRQYFDKLPLKCLKIEKAEGWVALLYKRRKK